MLDKIKGGLFGVAIGDALGGTTEFMSQEEINAEYGTLTEIVGGGYWNLQPGDITDDTEMTIAVVKGLMANSNNPIDEIGKQFLRWEQTNPKDIGITIRRVFQNYHGDWFQAAEHTHRQLNGKSAGNGSLMRCLPIALAYSDVEKMKEITTLQSNMTHYDELAAEACVIYNSIAGRVLGGEALKSAILTEIKGTRYEGLYEVEPDCLPDGFVVHTFKWVLYWLLTCDTFEEVVVGAANKGHDSDTVAAIAGGLKGLEVGCSNLPVRYKAALLCRKELEAYGNILRLIRDKDTRAIKKELDRTFVDLVGKAKKLKDMVERDAYKNGSGESLLSDMKDDIYLCRLSFDDDDLQYDKKLLTWRQVENRYIRSKRLFDLGAPKIIIHHEVNWLLTMITHMVERHKGNDPQFTLDQLEELANAD